eukprot:scaffold8867_cov118-Isochrysis_galbana.AAC.8
MARTAIRHAIYSAAAAQSPGFRMTVIRPGYIFRTLLQTQWVSAPLPALMPPHARPPPPRRPSSQSTPRKPALQPHLCLPQCPLLLLQCTPFCLLSSAQNHADEPPEKRARTEVSA